MLDPLEMELQVAEPQCRCRDLNLGLLLEWLLPLTVELSLQPAKAGNFLCFNSLPFEFMTRAKSIIRALLPLIL